MTSDSLVKLDLISDVKNESMRVRKSGRKFLSPSESLSGYCVPISSICSVF